MGRINDCPVCLEKHQKIDRLKEEVLLLRQGLSYRERKDKDGFFGSSTLSSLQPLEASTEDEKRPKGAKIGHKGFGRKGFSVSEADRVELLVGETCPFCGSNLQDKGEDARSVLDIHPVKTEQVGI